MPDFSDNGFYLLLGLAAFWLPILGYALSLRGRAAHVEAETALLAEEQQQR